MKPVWAAEIAGSRAHKTCKIVTLQANFVVESVIRSKL